MRSARRIYWALLLAAGFAACDLNPQPLPPGDERDNGSSGSGGIQAPTTTPGSSSGGGEGPPNDGADAGAGDSGPTPNPDGGEDAGDGGDASDASND
jgi:hypothetical protein